MKKFYLFTLIILAFGCEEINKLTQFDIQYSEQITVPVIVSTDTPIVVTTPDIPTKTESIYQLNNTSKNLISTILLSEMSISHKLPNEGDLNFLSSLEIFINAENLSEEKIAWKYDIPETIGKNLDLETGNTNLKDYLNSEYFSLRISIECDSTILEEQLLDIQSNYTVKAELLP
ncbi:MAG: hypothetical protein PF481_06760 [Bacteroidales bacterium]|jgi:hypothetical protein|nr:hypothetical protein [Bacteroidales bacterium]